MSSSVTESNEVIVTTIVCRLLNMTQNTDIGLFTFGYYLIIAYNYCLLCNRQHLHPCHIMYRFTIFIHIQCWIKTMDSASTLCCQFSIACIFYRPKSGLATGTRWLIVPYRKTSAQNDYIVFLIHCVLSVLVFSGSPKVNKLLFEKAK